ncbi:MAG TPA: FKBP-type peptidyl-prolyl cis-trans isomerase [Rectinemataceae bacterium]|nr:FKBP-type peptidyl-prolyl cis-trans isomerase [Rectinemataceae bacterium]
MKKLLLPLALILLLGSCKGGNPSTSSAAAPSNSKTDVSYAFGMAIGKSLAATGVEIDDAAFLSGVKDVLAKKAPRLKEADAQGMIQTAITEVQTKIAAANKAKGEEFLAANGKKDGIKTTASGLQYQVIKEGSGPRPTATDTVKVDYVGTLLDGSTFDSSIETKEPAVFQVNQVIPGWQEAIQLMTVGSRYKVWIPANLAYGEQGAGDKVGPNSTLAFEITLLAIQGAAAK